MTKDNKPSIECSQNGPFIVRSLDKLGNSKDQALATKPVMALCRCGGSANKPFCDGTHSRIGFSGKKLADGSANKRENYRGKRITIHDNRGICAHAGNCTEHLATVFRMNQEPWIDPDADEVESIVATIKKCPSGALSYTIDELEYRDQTREPRITVSKDGPYYVSGRIELKGEPRGEGASEEHYALCRCGASGNKPFCDGSHWRIQFKDERN